VLPQLVLLVEDLCHEVEIAHVFERVKEANGGEVGLCAIGFFDFVQCVLLHDDICLLPERFHFVHGADLEREVDPRVAFILHLEHLCEVAVAKLLYDLEIVTCQRLFVGFNQSYDF